MEQPTKEQIKEFWDKSTGWQGGFEVGKQEGRWEVIDDMTIACANGNTDKQRLNNLCDVMRKWERKLGL